MARLDQLNREALSRIATIGLLIGLGLAPLRALADDNEDFDKLQRELRAAYQAAKYDKALEAAEKMHDLHPSHVDTIYNIACLHSLQGEKSKAYEWLEKAIDAGYDDADHLANDADFRTIRGEDRFRGIVERLRNRGAPSDPGDRNHDPKSGPGRRGSPGDGDSDEQLSREEQQELGEKVNELTQQLIEAAGDKDYEKALKLAKEANKLALRTNAKPMHALTTYNLACMSSLLKKTDDAFEYLDKAIALGGFGRDFVQQVEGDSDLDNIRDDPRYAKMLEKADKATGDGQPRSRWKVTLPEDYDASEKIPLIVVLHGGGADMNEPIERWMSAADEVGAILLTPQGGEKKGEGRFEWGRDLDDIESRVMDAIEAAMDKHKIDDRKIVLAGFSQGGWAAWGVAMRNPEMFCGIIPVCGRFAAESESMLEGEELDNFHVYIMAGDEDDDAILKSNRAAAKQFTKLGAKVKMQTYADVGHDYPKNADKELARALKFVLGD